MRFSFVFLLAAFYLNPALAAPPDDKNTKVTKATYSLSGDAELLTRFIDKGLSYTDSNPAMNASFLMNLGMQAKLGFWGSNISNVNSVDDNLWLKIMGEVTFQFNDVSSGKFYLSDDHFYSSNQRNGQMAIFDFYRNSYELELQWLSNFEGTHSAAEYFRFGRLWVYKKDFRYGGYAGYTNSHTSTYDSYFDFKLVGQYLMNASSSFEVAATFNSNGSQFGKRGDPAYYLGIKLSY